MSKQQAEQLAEEAIGSVEANGPTYVAEATVLVLNADGTYSVCDNGEEVSGLDKEGAIKAIVENLTGEG